MLSSAVNAHQFFTEERWASFEHIFDTYMFEASKVWIEGKGGNSLLDDLYRALDEVIDLPGCEMYSYNTDCDADPFLEKGAMKLKRIVSFRFCSLSYNKRAIVRENDDVITTLHEGDLNYERRYWGCPSIEGVGGLKDLVDLLREMTTMQNNENIALLEENVALAAENKALIDEKINSPQVAITSYVLMSRLYC
ncbi:hypothetical protein V2J09_015507 [Rumex salicifolius]